MRRLQGVRKEPTGVAKFKKPHPIEAFLGRIFYLGVREGDGGTQRGTILIWGYASTKRLRTPGLVVRVEDSRTHNQEDVGSNPTVYWMDISIASYYIERKTIKVTNWGTPKKKIKSILLY